MKHATTLEDAEGLRPQDIFDLDDAYEVVMRSLRRDTDRQGMFHPSAVMSCGRREVYGFTRAPMDDTMEPASQEIFDLGHGIHEIVGRRLEFVAAVMKAQRVGFEIRREVPFDRLTDALYVDFGIGGTTDAIVEIWADEWRQRGIIEVKSINKDNFLKLQAPKINHLLQAHIYAYRFNCPVIYIWYYCKDNSRRKVYRSAFSQALFNQALAWFESLLVHADRGTLPDRNEDFFMCPQCEYREICKPPILTKLRLKTKNTAMSSIRKRGRLG